MRYMLMRRGSQRAEVGAWLDTWDGPIRLEGRVPCLLTSGDLAFVPMLNRIRGHQGGVAQNLWYRTALCLQQLEGRWRRACDHSSVPFYLDGSYRAAVDLQPWPCGSCQRLRPCDVMDVGTPGTPQCIDRLLGWRSGAGRLS